MKPVKIRIISSVKDENGRQQPSEQICFGRMAEKNGTNYVFYEESSLPSTEFMPTSTITTPSFTISGVTKQGLPTAATTTSA